MKHFSVPIEKGFRARLMSPLGSYPADSFISASAALVVDPDMCFSIVRITKEESGFSEIDGLSPIEIPLLGCIALAGQGEDPAICPYPSYQTMRLTTDSADELTADFILKCKARLSHNVRHDYVSWPAGQVHRPPSLDGLPYRFISSRHLDAQRLVILRRLETANPVLLRGVSCLIKANVNWNHGEFREAACIYLCIALDAAFSLTLRKLRETGLADPTSQDAANYVDKIFGHEASFDKFFEGDYYNRIAVIHPDNRYGAETRPSLLADDFLDLNDSLIPLFQHIALNY